MSASAEVSDLVGRLFQPEAGRVISKMFLRRSSNRELSNNFEETGDLMTGYSLYHCEIFRTLFFLSLSNFAWFEGWARTAWRFAGGHTLSKESLNTRDPPQQEGDTAWHNLRFLWYKGMKMLQQPWRYVSYKEILIITTGNAIQKFFKPQTKKSIARTK